MKIWKARNEVVFSSKIHEVEGLFVGEVKSISWRCFLVTKKGGSCMYYKWYSNPPLCFNN